MIKFQAASIVRLPGDDLKLKKQVTGALFLLLNPGADR
jgi:hypothetical protein